MNTDKGTDTDDELPGRDENDPQSEPTPKDEEKMTHSLKRGRDRPPIVQTGNVGRPKKEYNVLKVDDLTPSSETVEFDAKEKDAEGTSWVSHQEQAYTAEVSVPDVLEGPDAEKWVQAICSEFESILANDTWDVVKLPPGKHSIGSRLVLRNKYNAQGTVDRRKARLVAQGFSQRPGVDFTDTFAPVARLSSVRILLSIAAAENLKLRQLDITTAYLNGYMDEVVYMRPPSMMKDYLEKIIESRPNKDKITKRCKAMISEIERHRGDVVCKLHKAL